MEASPATGLIAAHQSHLAAPLLALNLGVTGHRPARLPEDTTAILSRLEHVFWRIRAALSRIHEQGCGTFSSATPHLRLTSSLAAGADVMAAQAAIEAGYELGACLPFAEAEYRKDFSEGAELEAFDALLAKSAAVIELAGERGAENAAYEAAGLTMLSLSDLVIAVWDGERAAGPGGTAEIVGRAVDDNVPVIHVPVDPERPIELLWAGQCDLPSTRPTLWTAPRCDFDDGIEGLVRSLVLPPDEPVLPQIVDALAKAPQWLTPVHKTWPLLLGLFGANRVKAGGPSDAASDAGEGQSEETSAFSRHLDRHLEPLARASDRSANLFGLMHRSGFVNNFTFAALAVVFAATAIFSKLVTAHASIWFTVAEIASLTFILVNTWRGTQSAWHAKWLQMRHLAEWSRVLTFALPLGNPLLRHDEEAQTDWIRWRARAAARAAGYPSIPASAATMDRMRRTLLEAVAGQIAYHHRNAARMHRMDHRTHAFGKTVFSLSLAVAVAHFGHESAWIKELLGKYPGSAEWLFSLATMLSVALPALGAAIYGIRLQGDFMGLAERSERIASQLEGLRDAVEAGSPSQRLAAEWVRQLATIMLQDTADWRRTFEGRPLVLPS